MPYLKCNAEKCKYNCCCKCTKEEIQIGKWFAHKPEDIECQDYIQSEKFFNEEFARDLVHQTLHNLETKIDCKAVDCIYNSSAVCVAKDIQVEPCIDQKAETVCVSYRRNQKSMKD